jgi:hypothetical protein
MQSLWQASQLYDSLKKISAPPDANKTIAGLQFHYNLGYRPSDVLSNWVAAVNSSVLVLQRSIQSTGIPQLYN